MNMNKERMEDLGVDIKKIYGVDNVADKAGVPRRIVLKFCNDYTKVTIRDLDRIVRAVGELQA